jgi:Fic family protein
MKHEKKNTVLTLLQTQINPLSLGEILTRLGEDYSERTVRRWLQEFVQLGLVDKVGKKKSTVYRALPVIQPDNILFSEASVESLAYIHQPLFNRSPKSYNADWLDKYQPNVTHYLSDQQREELKVYGQRDDIVEPAGTYARKIYHRLLIDLSYNSSRLEGNTYSRLDTEKLILEGTDNPLKLDEEKIMILNHKEAIRYLVDNSTKITPDVNTICTLHYLLSDGLMPTEYSGKVREHSVRVSSSTYITLEGAQVLKKQLQLICHKACEIHDFYEQSFFLLVHLAYLQVFADVNKRTSRLSANIPLIKNNLVPLSFNGIDKDDYISAILAVYELNDVHPLAELYVFSYKRTCQEYSATLDVLGFDEVRIRYRRERREMLRYIILNQLHSEPLKHYVDEKVKFVIPEEYAKDFLEDLNEDLKYINASRIVGLGITVKDLEEWIRTKL